jgi:murein L,D-transpeptidase YafK
VILARLISKTLLLFIICCEISFAQTFLQRQLEYNHVNLANTEKDSIINYQLSRLNLRLNEIFILMIVYKHEKELELWVKSQNEREYTLLNIYKICRVSGILGPKRKEGDLQTPEGFYNINNFNPLSNFYLSLGIDYPNRSDMILSPYSDIGCCIYIHGDCATIGCLPMTDDTIKEIYIYAINARNNGQVRIPVYIFPVKYNENYFNIFNKEFYDNDELIDFWRRKYIYRSSFNYKKFDKLIDKYHDNFNLISFWYNIKEGYEKFYTDRTELKIRIDNNGRYIFN